VSETLNLENARSLWWDLQGLGESGTDVGKTIGRTGWLRTLGGTDVYIAARARVPKLTRADLDAAVTKGTLRVVPAVRGCIYLVPSHVVGDLMALNAEPWRKQTEKELAKAGSKMLVVEKVAKAVVDALATPMTPDALRKALPKDSIPSFGEAGKKVGLSSPLPLALRLLEFDGKIERTLEGGRLDSERYVWRKAQWKVPAASKAPLANVVKSFFEFAGPSTLAHVSAWTGIAQRDLKPIVADFSPVEIESVGTCFSSIAIPKKLPAPRGVRLLAFEDNYLVNHGGPAVVTDPKHHAIEADIWGSGKPETLGEADHILSRSIVVDGLVAGFWEVDPKAGGAVWTTFEKPAKKVADEIDALTDATAKFLLEDVGNARVFSLDTMEEVQARADRITKLAKKSAPRKK
jgi:hypothetical protein